MAVSPVAPERSASGEPRAGADGAAPRSWPARRDVFIVRAGADLELRATSGGFRRVVASGAQHVLHDTTLDLLWYSDERRLWVVDLRASPLDALAPIPIASALPPHVELAVVRGGREYVTPRDTCDVAPALTLHWAATPWLEGGDGQRLSELEGHEWLARERRRARLGSARERAFHPSGDRAPLPASRARCEDAEWCGAALPFAPAGWQLVVADQAQGADCWHFGCLLYEAATTTFASPPLPARRGPAEALPSGPCGPYLFDAAGGAFLIEDQLCAVGGACQPLEAAGIGWLEPGEVVGAGG